MTKRDASWRKAAFYYRRARVNRFLGRTQRAIELCRAAIALADYTKARELLAEIELPGPDYFRVLARLHAHLRPRTYLEIGVFRGDSLRLAGADTLSIGIDPAPRLRKPPRPRARIFTETSGDFFAKHDVVQELGGRRIELAFIDGLHQFEFALRDFIDVERHSEPSAIVL
ncbi:MAG: class I SAM-dependent methyltransferase, partial [Steroidobacteraceae bacterium]